MAETTVSTTSHEMYEGNVPQLYYTRRCLAQTKLGKRCKRAVYVDADGRCPGHRDKDRFPISPEKHLAMVEFEVFWDLTQRHVEHQLRDLAHVHAEEARRAGEWDDLTMVWNLRNTNPRRPIERPRNATDGDTAA